MKDHSHNRSNWSKGTVGALNQQSSTYKEITDKRKMPSVSVNTVRTQL